MSSFVSLKRLCWFYSQKNTDKSGSQTLMGGNITTSSERRVNVQIWNVVFFSSLKHTEWKTSPPHLLDPSQRPAGGRRHTFIIHAFDWLAHCAGLEAAAADAVDVSNLRTPHKHTLSDVCIRATLRTRNWNYKYKVVGCGNKINISGMKRE